MPGGASRPKTGGKSSLYLDGLGSPSRSSSPEKGSPTFRGWALTAQDMPSLAWTDAAAESKPSGHAAAQSQTEGSDQAVIRAADEGRQEARRLWRTTKVNRYYLPFEKLPPLGPDPRPLFAGIPPQCCHIQSVPRTHRIIERWSSMPQLRSQLPLEHLRAIESAEGGEGSLEAALRRSRQKNVSPLRTMLAQDSPCRRRRYKGDPYLRDVPNIACECCEHPSPKPWHEKRALSTVAVALMVATMEPSTEPVEAAKETIGANETAVPAP